MASSQTTNLVKEVGANLPLTHYYTQITKT